MGITEVSAIIGAAASLLCTLVVAALSFFIKKTLVSLEDADKKNAARIDKLEEKLGDLKADLPLVYVTREDYIRVMNKVEDKLDQILYSGPQTRKEGQSMAIMDEVTEQEVNKNKAIRGYIIRALAKGNQNTLLIRQVANALVGDSLIYSPDISKYLEYLKDGGYIAFTGKTANAYQAYRSDSVIKLTKKGVDLVEGTVDDPGVDV